MKKLDRKVLPYSSSNTKVVGILSICSIISGPEISFTHLVSLRKCYYNLISNTYRCCLQVSKGDYVIGVIGVNCVSGDVYGFNGVEDGVNGVKLNGFLSQWPFFRAKISGFDGVQVNGLNGVDNVGVVYDDDFNGVDVNVVNSGGGSGVNI